jgi:hypothetical protein
MKQAGQIEMREAAYIAGKPLLRKSDNKINAWRAGDTTDA